jgi:hypothetical protein
MLAGTAYCGYAAKNGIRRLEACKLLHTLPKPCLLTLPRNSTRVSFPFPLRLHTGNKKFAVTIFENSMVESLR